MALILFGIYEAYVEDNKKIKNALNMQYKDGDPSKGYAYGNHSFDYWLQWIDMGLYDSENFRFGDDVRNKKSYRDFVIRYIQIVNPEEDLSGNNLDKFVKNDYYPIMELWVYAAYYVKTKESLTNFSRLKFEVTKIEYSGSTGRIKEVVIEEYV